DAGVAVVTLKVARGERWRVSLALTVVAPDGARATHRANLGVARVWEPTPAVLVRPERVLVPRGVPLAAEVLSSLKDGMAYLEAVKDGQTLRTAAGRLVDGRARITLPLDDGVFGTVSLRGEVVDGTGRRGSHERLAYVERRRDLRVEVTPDKAVHAPGEQLTVRFRTVDGVTGAGTPAQIGVVMVDEAVLALAPVRTGMERVFFTLGRELETPPRSVRLVPHGYTTTRLVGETGREALRDRVLRLLLASARPPWASRAESDPWSRRRTEWERQARRLPGLVESFMVTHVAGVREGGRWRFRDDLFPAMEAAGTLPAAAARDPWNRPLTPAAVARVAWGFRYDDYARRAVVQKLRRAYASVAAKAGSLPRERVAGRPATQSPHVWTTDDARRLCTATDLIDPWGNEMRVQRGPRYLYAFSGEFLSRHVLTSAGPDGEFGTDDDVQPDGDEYRPPKKGQRVKSVRGGVLAVLSGRASGSVYGIGGLGLSGTGRGGGGAGIGTIGLGSFGTIGRGGGVVERVRESFPETMLWRPDLVTDASGAATLSATVADSITTWRLLAVATAEDGRLGVAELGVRVFQDFFVDVDLPDRLTQGDELAVPVAVYNYQKRPAHVALRLEEAPWFTRLSDAAQELDLAPGQVGVRYFRVRALAVGRHALTVHARGGALTDAVRKSTEVAPDGVAVETSHSERLGAAGSYAVTVPADAIAGASRLAVRVFPGAMSQTLDGLEGMIRMPSGCFEQTSSTTYPNALILDYLRRTGTASPALVRRAAEYLALGYQRLLSFEVRGGGFSWFGNAPANQVLTAYGLNEFHDMAKVRFVDPRLIERTTRWLLAHQRPDGGFDPDKENINDGAVDAMAGDRLRTTAYIALALARAGTRGPATRKAAHFVSANLAKARDPYTLALAADLFAALGDAEAGRTLARLWPLHERATRGVSFAPARATVFHGGGNAGRIETTALVAEALVTSRRDPARARQTLDFLIASKDALGSWHSTQATVLTLRALLAGLGGRARGDVTVDVDGARAGALVLGGADGDATRELDLTPFARPGAHRIDLKFRGQGEPLVHVVARAFRPRAAVAAGGAAPGDLRLSVEYDRTAVATAEAVTARVRLTTASRTPINMPVVEIGVPPGFGLDEDALEPLVRRGLIDKYERGPGKLVLYVSRLAAGAPLAFDVPLRPRMPLRVQAPASTVYEYYRPESRAEVVPVVLTVRGS
ncbi:MAG TPA: alpha-2-macroglobulin family protein, partial [Polyangia bacterium]